MICTPKTSFLSLYLSLSSKSITFIDMIVPENEIGLNNALVNNFETHLRSLSTIAEGHLIISSRYHRRYWFVGKESLKKLTLSLNQSKILMWKTFQLAYKTTRKFLEKIIFHFKALKMHKTNLKRKHLTRFHSQELIYALFNVYCIPYTVTSDMCKLNRIPFYAQSIFKCLLDFVEY